jgi:hypothetical protein
LNACDTFRNACYPSDAISAPFRPDSPQRCKCGASWAIECR